MNANWRWLALGLAVLAAGCNKSDNSAGGTAGGGGAAAAPATPPEPDVYAQEFANSMASGDVAKLWAAFPPKYQADMKSVINAVASNLDAELYDKAFAVANKLVQVLKTKKDYIINSPSFPKMVQPLPKEMVIANWDSVVGGIESVTSSEINTLEGLKKADPGQFLATTGNRLFQASKAAPESNAIIDKVKTSKVTVVKRDGNTARLKVETEGETPDEFDVTYVDGKWLPTKLVEGWDKQIATVRDEIAPVLKPAPELKSQIMAVIQTIDGSLDRLLAAPDQAKFDAELTGLQFAMSMLGGDGPGGRGPGGPGPGGPGSIGPIPGGPGGLTPPGLTPPGLTPPGGASTGPSFTPGVPGAAPISTAVAPPRLTPPGTTPAVPPLPR